MPTWPVSMLNCKTGMALEPNIAPAQKCHMKLCIIPTPMPLIELLGQSQHWGLSCGWKNRTITMKIWARHWGVGTHASPGTNDASETSGNLLDSPSLEVEKLIMEIQMTARVTGQTLWIVVMAPLSHWTGPLRAKALWHWQPHKEVADSTHIWRHQRWAYIPHLGAAMWWELKTVDILTMPPHHDPEFILWIHWQALPPLLQDCMILHKRATLTR